MQKKQRTTQRLIIVSNRLPFTIVQEGSDLKFKESVGGVATGLSAYLESQHGAPHQESDYVWVGWPGKTIDEEARETVRSKAVAEYHSYPVFLSEEDVENFYQGFCNKTIWPLFHYFPEFVRYDLEYWQHYNRVNQIFCKTLLELVQPDDLVWIHDYHLMLLPDLLKKQMPSVSVGFFLHIPFPTFEVFRLLPGKWRRGILEGIVGADLVGFHTYDNMQDFLRCALRILGFDHNMGQLQLPDRIVSVGTYPMGIDFLKFHNAGGSAEIHKTKEELQKLLGDSKIILSVDRLDYSKGIINRLQGFEAMLEMNPEWRAKVTLIMIVVPSRVDVEHYDLMQKQIEGLVGKINGRFGSISWTPIIYQFSTLSFYSLVARYALAHVALITPLRDGMNLIAKEYIASRADKTGVLILSEMAGAAKELGEAIIINPNNRTEIAEALKEALELSVDEQIRRNTFMQQRLRRYDVVRWASDFITDLTLARERRETLYAKLLTSNAQEQLFHDYTQSQQRLLLLDYDGTLTPFFKHPYQAKPTKEVVKLLHDLSEDTNNTVVVISGRDKDTLESWFGSLSIGLVAENGIWIKGVNEEWQMPKSLTNEWKPKLLPILEMYADRLPGAFVEEKDFSLVWHYHTADLEQGNLVARELTDALLAFTMNIDLQVLSGHKSIELRNAGINKAATGLHWLSSNDYDFILAIGDDWTDEDLFMILPQTAYSIRVGVTSTPARFNLRNTMEVQRLLLRLKHRRKFVATDSSSEPMLPL